MMIHLVAQPSLATVGLPNVYPSPGCDSYKQSAAMMWAGIIISKVRKYKCHFICNITMYNIELMLLLFILYNTRIVETE